MSWLDEEQEKLKAESPTETYPEALKLLPNIITKISIDFSVPFKNWTDRDGKVKAIIPITEKGIIKTFWLNKKNPLYHQLIEAGRKGQKDFAILQSGDKKETKYSIIKEA